MKPTAAANRRFADRKEAQDKYIALRVQGIAQATAMRMIGRHVSAVTRWRTETPGFREREERAAKVALGEEEEIDFAAFREGFFGHDTPEHHAIMAEAIETAPVDSITLILAPPEAAKTTMLADYCCWKLALDPNYRIAIVSESHDLAKKILGQIARRMTDEVQFARYINRYGPFKAPDRVDGKAWNANAITVLRADHDEKEPSIEARGATGQIYGARYDLLLLDDIQSTTNIGETDKLITHFRQTMLSRVSVDKGRTVIVGSRVEKKDFYERILEEEDGELIDRFVSIKALTHEGESYWPEYWPLERLERRRKKVGPIAWGRAYMQEPASVGAQTFTEEMLYACTDDTMSMGFMRGSEVICSVDPALSGHTALTALGADPAHAWLIDAEAYPALGRTEEILNRMEQFTIKYRPTVWVVEIGAYQGALANDQRLREMATRYHFSIIQHTTTRTKADPVLGVGSMASMFSLKEITVPYADPDTKRKAEALFKELLDWRPDVPTRMLVQDRVMSLWFAWREWMKRRRTYGIKRRQEWRPTWAKEPELVA